MANQTTPAIQVKDSNVGIGTNSPLYKLNVIGDISFPSRNTAGTYRIGMGREDGNGWSYAQNIAFISDGGGGYITFSTQEPGVGGGEYMRLNYTGNLLIGTTTDSGYKLRVNGTTMIDSSLRLVGNMTVGSDTSQWSLAGVANGGAIWQKSNSGAGGYDDRYLRLGNVDNNGIPNYVLTIFNSNVGIGTTNPTQKLDVATGNIALGYNQTATNSIYKDFATYHAAGNVPSELSMVIYDGSPGAVRIKNTRTGSYNSQAIHFDVHQGGVAARGDAMIINYTGNVLIGTTTDSGAKLRVYGGYMSVDGSNSSISIEPNYGGSGAIEPGTLIAAGGTNANISIIPSGGGVVGTKVVGAAYNGSAWRSMLEYANVSSGEPVLSLVRAAGNVGIGTTAPTTLLQVASSQTNSSIRTGGLEMQSYAVNNSWYAENVYFDGSSWRLRSNGYATQMYMQDGTIDFNRVATGAAGDAATLLTTIRLNNTGNVLIGTTADNGYKLRVNGKGYFDNNVVIAPTSESWAEGLSFVMPTTSTWGGLRWRRERVGNDGNWYIGYTALDSTDDLVFGANNGGTQVDNIIRLTKAGNVGIGNSNPGSLLQVGNAGAAPTGLATLTLTGANTAPQIATKPGLYHRHAVGLGVFSDYAMSFQVNGSSALSDAMYITNTGNVGIGTTGPQAKLHTIGRTKLQNDYFAEWRNVVNFAYDGTSVGGYVVTTPFAIDSNYDMHITHVIGYGYGGETLIDFKVVYYVYISAPANYSIVDSGNDGMVKYLGKDSNGYVTICFGGLSDSNYFYRFNVNHYATRYPGNDYSSGWSISQTTSANYGMSALYALSPAITQRTSGNVGIGTTNPGGRLHIATPDPATNFVAIDFRNPTYGIYGKSNSISARGNTLEFTATDYNGGSVTTREVLTLRPEGNVGIGTTAPPIKLYVGTVLTGTNGNGTYASDAIAINSSESITIGPDRRADWALDATTATSTTFQSKLNIWSDNEDHITFGGASTHLVSAWESFKIWINNDSAAAGTLHLYHTSSKTEFVRLTGSGNNWINGGDVGIGTTNPQSKLHVETSSSNPFRMVRGTTNFGFEMGGGTIGLYDYEDVTYRWFVDSVGNVGIGTTSPTEKLHVDGNAVLTYNNSYQGINSIGNKAILARVSPTTGIINYAEYATAANLNGFVMGSDDARVKGNIATDSLEFITNGSTQVTVLSNGNVGIANTNPSEKLSVTGNIRMDNGAADGPQLVLGSSGFSDWNIDNFSGSLRAYYGSTEYTRLTSSGNFGIGVSPSYKLDVAGDTRITSGSLGVGVVPNATDGRIDASNDIVAYSSSDRRLKENITPIANALDKVKSLTGVEFDWKPEHKKAHGYEGHDTGVIAQEVQEVMPTAVRTNDTGYLAVRYEKMIGLLIEAMKEQQTQIDELKAKLDGLTK